MSNDVSSSIPDGIALAVGESRAIARLLDACVALLAGHSRAGLPLRAVEQIVDYAARSGVDSSDVAILRAAIGDVRQRAKEYSWTGGLGRSPSFSQQGALPMSWRVLRATLDDLERAHGGGVLDREAVLRLDVGGEVLVGGLRAASVEECDEDPALVLDGDDGSVVTEPSWIVLRSQSTSRAEAQPAAGRLVVELRSDVGTSGRLELGHDDEGRTARVAFRDLDDQRALAACFGAAARVFDAIAAHRATGDPLDVADPVVSPIPPSAGGGWLDLTGEDAWRVLVAVFGRDCAAVLGDPSREGP